MNRRIALHVAAMLALGALSFAALGFLVAWRQGQPVSAPAHTDESTDPGDPGAVLARGLAASAEAGRENLAAGDRGEAMVAVDAAYRGADVGRHAALGELRWAFAAAYQEIEAARTAVEIGSPSGAREHLAQASATLHAAMPFAGPVRFPARDRWDDYEGAVVLNAMGSRIGEVVDIARRRDGDVMAELRIGGENDVLGFIDIGGTRLTVAAESLLYGKPQLVGVLHVVVPTFATTPSEVATSLAS